jgi:CBS domain containing-hemolysin-like protein
MGKLSRIPELNDQVEADGVRLKVAEMDGLRVARVSLTRLDAPAAASAEPETPA